MAVLAIPAVHVLKDVIMEIGTDGFQKHLSSVKFEPASSMISWQGLTPDSTFTEAGTPTWTCVLGYAQDWESANSLSQYLFENEGTTVPAEFVPKTGGDTFNANVSIVPGTIGGDVNAVAVATVTLGCDRPVRTPGA